MAENPEGIVLRRHRDFAGRFPQPWSRWALFALVLAVPALGLVNVWGQKAGTATADSPRASLELHAPTRVRGGLLWQARFTIRAHRDLGSAALVLDSGWLDGMQMNTVEPSPAAETSLDGSPAFTLGKIAAGDTYTLFVEFQVNPTTFGRKTQTVRLYDGTTQLLTLDRTLTIFP